MSNIESIKTLTNVLIKNPKNANAKGKLNIALGPLRLKTNKSINEQEVFNSAAKALNAPSIAVNAPVGNASVGNASVGNAPVGNAPVGNAPVGNAPVGNAPVGNAPVVNAPVVNAPVVNAPVVPVNTANANKPKNANRPANATGCKGTPASVKAKGMEYEVCVGEGKPEQKQEGGRRTRHKKQRTSRKQKRSTRNTRKQNKRKQNKRQ